MCMPHYHDPSSSASPDILFERFFMGPSSSASPDILFERFFMGYKHKSEKGNNSVK